MSLASFVKWFEAIGGVRSSRDPVTGGGELSAGGQRIRRVTEMTINTPISVEQTTSQKNLVTFTIPEGDCVPGAHIAIKAVFSAASANNKSFQLLLNDGGGGSSGGTIIFNAGGIALNGMYVAECHVFIRDASTQLSGLVNSVSGAGTSASQPVITNKNMRFGLDVTVAASLATAADYVTLESLSYEVMA